jgi:hypothetical protein
MPRDKSVARQMRAARRTQLQKERRESQRGTEHANRSQTEEEATAAEEMMQAPVASICGRHSSPSLLCCTVFPSHRISPL